MRFDIDKIIDQIKFSRDFNPGDFTFIIKPYSFLLIFEDKEPIELGHKKLYDLFNMYENNRRYLNENRLCFVQYIIDHYKNEYTDYVIVEPKQLNPHENQLPQASPDLSTYAPRLGF